MTSRLNRANQNAMPLNAQEVVAKPLHELPKQEKRKVTTELLRIQNLMNALDTMAPKHAGQDKADRPTI